MQLSQLMKYHLNKRSIETNNGRMRYAFIGLSERDATLKIEFIQKALPDLRFGSGSASIYK